MAHEIKEIKSIHFSGTERGKLEIAVIYEPYGEGSDPVASIGVFLDSRNTEPDWKVHIPGQNIDDVMEALEEAKRFL